MTNDTSSPSSSPSPSATAVAEAPDPRDLLARAMATGVAVVAGVRPEQMALPTPCSDFDVRGLIAHLVAVLDRIVVIGNRGNVLEVPDRAALRPDDEWVGLWHTTAHLVFDAWADDDDLESDRQLPWAVMPGRDALEIYVNELTVHTWDLARATGQQPSWDEEVVETSLAAIHAQLPDGSRGEQWAAVAASLPADVPFAAPFADAVDVPDGAPAIDRLVAWNGRRP
jgi:uncharacterized protein (TIGR03086 family)